MKRLLAFSAVVVLSLCACSTPDDSSISIPDEQSSSISTTIISTKKDDSSAPSSTSIVKEYLEEQGYTVTQTKTAMARLEFYITTQGLEGTVPESPDGWEGTKSALLDTALAAAELLPEDETLFITLYLVDGDGNILASVLKDKLTDVLNAEKISAPTDNPSTITLEEFNAIRTGMSYQEVIDIVGGPGEVLSEVDLGFGDEHHTIMFSWNGEGRFGGNASITIQGGKVVSKAQFGLD